MLASVLPFLQYGGQRRWWRRGVSLFLLAASSFLLQIAACAAKDESSSLDRVRRTIEHKHATSYFSDARELLDSAGFGLRHGHPARRRTGQRLASSCWRMNFFSSWSPHRAGRNSGSVVRSA